VHVTDRIEEKRAPVTDDKKDAGDLRKELNSLWKSTIDQFDEIKNVIVRSSGAGKAKLDATFLKRQRDKLLAELGARLMELADAGEITLPEEVQGTAGRVRELEREIDDQEGEVDRLLRPEDEPEQAGAAETTPAKGHASEEGESTEVVAAVASEDEPDEQPDEQPDAQLAADEAATLPPEAADEAEAVEAKDPDGA
jgi:hypothetical protein